MSRLYKDGDSEFTTESLRCCIVDLATRKSLCQAPGATCCSLTTGFRRFESTPVQSLGAVLSSLDRSELWRSHNLHETP